MATVLQFVDAVGSTTPLLDLNTSGGGGFTLSGDTPIRLDPPELRRTTSGTFLRDGQVIPAGAFDNRVITFSLYLLYASAGQRSAALAGLAREAGRTGAVLRVQLEGMTSSTWYRLIRSPANPVRRVSADGQRLIADVELLAEPFGLGSVVVLGATSSPENANPYFEVNVASWSGTFGTPTRSTAQAHEGIASMLITPTGAGNTHVDAEQIGDGSSIAGRGFRATAWLYSPGGYATGVGPRINFYDAGMGYLTTAGATPAISAGAWTFYDTGVLFAPAGAVYRQIIISYAGTPTAGQTLHADEAKISATGDYQVTNDPAATVNGSYFDVSGLAGDVETPPKFELSPAGNNMAPVLAVRRHGTPSNITPVVQAEAATSLGTDTTTGADANMSGGNRARCTFATVTAMATRLTVTLPTSGGLPWVDRRGTYRMYVVVASSAGGTTYALRTKVDAQFGAATLLTGDTATYIATDASRQLVDLGLVQVPVGEDPIYDGYGAEKQMSALSLQIQAQRVSGAASSLDFDYVIAMPADEEFCALGTVYSDLVLDAVNDAAWMPWVGGIGEVHAYGAPAIPRRGAIPLLAPGQTNRIWLLRPDGLGTDIVRGPDTKTRTTTVKVTYWPRYLGWAP